MTHTIVAEELKPATPSKPVPASVKTAAVRRYLEQALEPYLAGEGGDCEGAVLKDVLSAVVADRKLVNRIWSLKQCQVGVTTDM